MTTPEEADLTAAELALGVLEGEERAAALRRVLADPAFARDVEWWRRRLSALYAEVPSVEPGTDLSRRVATAPNDDGPRLKRWRAGAIVAAVAAAILLIVAVEHPAPKAAPAIARKSAPLQIAILAPRNAQPVAIVFDPNSRMVKLRGTLAVASDRDAELWAINADGVPHAAGLLTGRRGALLAVAPQIAVNAGTTLAISIEPKGGSPTSTPTGPVVASGALAAI